MVRMQEYQATCAGSLSAQVCYNDHVTRPGGKGNFVQNIQEDR
jgi:hypothetical protein